MRIQLKKRDWGLFSCKLSVLFLKMGQPQPFFVYFWSFQSNNTILTTNQFEKMSCPSSIRCQDSNPQHLEHQSSPITTRPGLLPNLAYLVLMFEHHQIPFRDGWTSDWSSWRRQTSGRRFPSSATFDKRRSGSFRKRRLSSFRASDCNVN